MPEPTTRDDRVAAYVDRVRRSEDFPALAQRIRDTVRNLLDDAQAYAAMRISHNPFGDGLASGRIVEAARSFLANQANQA